MKSLPEFMLTTVYVLNSANMLCTCPVSFRLEQWCPNYSPNQQHQHVWRLSEMTICRPYSRPPKSECEFSVRFLGEEMHVKISEALYRQDYPSIGERTTLFKIPSAHVCLVHTSHSDWGKWVSEAYRFTYFLRSLRLRSWSFYLIALITSGK